MLKRRNSLALLLAALLVSAVACAPKATATTAATAGAMAAAVSASAAPTASATVQAGGWTAGGDASIWTSDGAYKLSAENGELKAEVKKTTQDAAFTATFPAMDISARPLASLSARSAGVARVSIGLTDVAGHTGWMVGLAGSQEMAVGDHPMVHTFDFSEVRTINLHKITAISIAVDRGSPGSTATVWLSDIRVGGDAVDSVPLLPVGDQQAYVGAPPLPVDVLPAWARDVGTLKWDMEMGGNAARDGEVIPQGDGWQFRYALTGQAGSSPVKLTFSDENGAQQALQFTITAEDNLPPAMDDVPAQIAAAGTTIAVPLTGIDDGNPAARQAVALSAAAEDPTVATVQAQHAGDDRWGSLAVQALRPGSTAVTVTVGDDAGAQIQKKFTLTVFESLNQPPRFDAVSPVTLTTGGNTRIPLTGVTAGEAGQKVRFAVTGGGDMLQARVVDGELVLRAGDKPAEGKLTVTATDDGGNEGNNGDGVFSREVPFAVKAASITGLRDGFDGPDVEEELAKGGEGAHTMHIDDGALRVDVDKAAAGNVWAGLWYPIPGELDLSANPVITLRMKASEARPMCIFLWDSNDVYNTAATVTVNVEKEWADYTFDFTGLDRDSDGRTVDFRHIKALLINFVPGMMFKGTFWLDDLRVGDKANAKAPQPPAKLELKTIPRLTLAGQKTTFLIPGSGWDAKQLEASFDGDYAKLVEPPEVAFVAGGVELSLTPKAGAAGQGRLLLALTQGEMRTEAAMDLVVVGPQATADIAVDSAKTFQEIDGFGAFLGSGAWEKSKQDLVLPWVRDAGITMARFGVIDKELEPVNDNSNPHAAALSRFNRDALPLEWMKRLRDEGGVRNFVVTLWSPPRWMKFNKSLAATNSSTDNYMEPRYYEEFAEHVSALCAIVRESTGVDLYAVSLQNEPQFNEPYASALLDSDNMTKLIAIVGKRLRDDGFATKIFMPEALPQQKGIGTYIRALDGNADAAQYADIIAIHNYDGDGIHVGGAGAQEWAQIYAQANEKRPRKTWMSETSGHPNTWDGATTLFGNIHNALAYGNASAWMWWSFADTAANAQFGLLVDNQPTARYAISRHFYKAIQPGALRVQANAPEGFIATAYQNPDGSTAVVFYNAGAARLVAVAGAGDAIAQAWVSHEGLQSAPAQIVDGRVLAPSGSVVTVVMRK